VRYRFHILDVFTDQPFGGNRLAVLPEAAGIDGSTMQAIAAEFGFSETTFVLPPTRPGHDCRVRIFTPSAELPFAGHPTVGTALVLANLGRVRRTGDRARVVMQQLAGTVPVDLVYRGNQAFDAELTAPERPRIAKGPDLSECAALLGLREAELVAAHVASAGTPFLIVEVDGREALGQARSPAIEACGLLVEAGCSGVLLFTRQTGLHGDDLQARLFAPLVGIVEDPATGSAAAALAGLLGTTEGRSDGWLGWRIGQGIEMGRPSLIRARALREGGAVAEVRVAGGAVPMAEGWFEVPSSAARGGLDDVAA
jgi:trans-2,3-dihydro-3-hydroxyanthranilate isomerase